MIDVAAAARRAHEAGDHHTLMEILETNPLELWFGVPLPELGEMFKAIPADALRDSSAAYLVSSTFFAPGIRQPLPDPGFREKLRTDPSLRRWQAFADGWRARMEGDTAAAYELMRGMADASESFPVLVDRSRGFRSFFLGQAAFTAALVGRFQEALALYDRLLLAPQTPGFEFLSREARLRAALLHGLFGDQEAARIHHRCARTVPRTASWVEPGLDLEDALVEAVLMPDEDDAAAFDLVLGMTYREMGETWPFYVVALQRLASNSAKRPQMRERVEALQSAGLGMPVAVGFTGSVIGQVLALDSLASGNMSRAREELLGSAPEHWRTQLVACLLDISSSAPRRAIRVARALSEQTRNLRQADVRRQLILALAYYLEDEKEESLAILRSIGSTVTRSEVVLTRLLSPALADFAAQVPEWPADPQTGERGVLDQPPLSPSEIRVLLGLGKGQNRRQIAEELSVSENTIKSQQRTLYRKLGVNTAEQAILLAAQRGII